LNKKRTILFNTTCELNKIGVFSGRTVAVAVHKEMAETDALPYAGQGFLFPPL
jgi:hypothetical protein